MYRCCIFDLDGTLLNTIESLQNTMNATLSHFNFNPIDEAHIRKFVGDGYKMLVKRALLYAKDEALLHYEQALKIYMEEFSIHCMDGVMPYDGIHTLLDDLKCRGIRLAVLSNKPHEKTVAGIREIFGDGYFDFVAGEQPGVNRKPDPEGVFRILKQLDFSAEECLYVGDTNTDMETGIAAGVDTVGVLWGFRDEEELASYRPNYLVRTPEEIIEIVMQS